MFSSLILKRTRKISSDVRMLFIYSMSAKLLILLTLCVLSFLTSCKQEAEDPPPVSFEALIADPQRFRGKAIRVSGYLIKRTHFPLGLYSKENFSDNFTDIEKKPMPAVLIMDARLSNWFNDRSLHVELIGEFSPFEGAFGKFEPLHSIRFLD